jgi:hypothetical protein
VAVRAFFVRLGGFDHLVFTTGESLQLESLASTDIEAARSSHDRSDRMATGAEGPLTGHARVRG